MTVVRVTGHSDPSITPRIQFRSGFELILTCRRELINYASDKVKYGALGSQGQLTSK